jgi:hypothetical protein
MKKHILFSVMLLAALPSFSQSMRIYMTDQSQVSVNLADVDSITFSVSNIALDLNVSDWSCTSLDAGLAKSADALELVDQGLKLPGHYEIAYNSMISSLVEKTIYLTWSAHGSGISIKIFTGLEAVAIATELFGSFQGFSDEKWYYTRITISANSATTVTALNAFDNNGGIVVQNSFTPLIPSAKTFSLAATGDASSYLLLSQARVE